MRYLCRLAGVPGGRGLDPFTGSGSTLGAADDEGLDFDGIERDPEFAELARLSNGLPATEASGWIRLRNRLERAIVPRLRKGKPHKPAGPTVAEIKAMGEGGRANVEAWLAVTGGDARELSVPSALTPWTDAFTPPEGYEAPSSPATPPQPDPEDDALDALSSLCASLAVAHVQEAPSLDLPPADLLLITDLDEWDSALERTLR